MMDYGIIALVIGVIALLVNLGMFLYFKSKWRKGK